MCSIVGLVSERQDDVAARLKAMLERTRHRGPDGAGVALGMTVRHATSVGDLSIHGLVGPRGLGHSRLRITGASGLQPLRGCGRGVVVAVNGEIWNHNALRKVLEANDHRFLTETDSEVLVHYLEDALNETGDLAGAVRSALHNFDGEYAFAAFDGSKDEFVLARDVVGVKQLYYGEQDGTLAFSSEKKPLWDLSIQPTRLLPGQVVRLSARGAGNRWRFEPLHRLEVATSRLDPEIRDEVRALEAYWAALAGSIGKRVDGHTRIGVIFSGGVDSVLVARIAQRMSVDVRCYSSGLLGSGDVEASRKAAEALGLPLAVSELDAAMIENELPSILTAIESTNHLQVDVAIPIYFAVKRAAADGIRVMLTGQGADELFAGYPWYSDVLARAGKRGLLRSLRNDIDELYRDTLEREDKITMFHGIELRVPYLDPHVIDTAMRISCDLKIRDGELKYVHRKLAEGAGVPSSIAWRPKEAAQHGSAVHAALKHVLERLSTDLGPPHDTSAAPTADSSERLGSAYRYGGDAYRENQHYQTVLDALGVRAGLA